jgi:signal transduction histidine kinase
LLSNAIKYSNEQSIISIQVSVSSGNLKLLVRDQGIGIPEAQQRHLFSSFHRASNVGDIPGTGLGLAIVKRAVEEHNGNIDFKSKVDEGTIFVVTLPTEKMTGASINR